MGTNKKTKANPAKGDSEEILFDLPEVKDIPGQEHIHPPRLREYADTTISSDGEEGKGIKGLNDDTDDLDGSTNVSNEENELLGRSESSMAGSDDENQRRATLDNRDDDGELLNEEVDASGRDLDVPGSEDDDDMEDTGAEDEENNSYSLGGDRD